LPSSTAVARLFQDWTPNRSSTCWAVWALWPKPLCELGWDTSPTFNATLADRRFLLRWPQGIRTHHLHLVVYGGEQWERHLAFRDRLRADPEVAGEYQKLKHELANQHTGDREAYTQGKTKFIANVIGSITGA